MITLLPLRPRPRGAFAALAGPCRFAAPADRRRPGCKAALYERRDECIEAASC
jgi:hypothetical protein